MMKRKINSVVLFLLLFTLVSAQGQVQVSGTEDMLNRLRLQELSGKSSDIDAYKDIFGTAFMNEEFMNGLIIMKDSLQYKGEFRYDMYAEQIEFKSNDLIYILSAPVLVNYVMIEDSKLIRCPYITKLNGTKNTYFVIEADGPVMLLRRNQVLYREGEAAKLYQDAKPPTFVKASDPFYIKFPGESARCVTNKKRLQAIMGDENGMISTFMKKEKISANKVDDLIRLVNYYNSIK